MLQSHSQQTDKNILSFFNFFIRGIFYSANSSLHNFSFSLLLLIRCILSLFHMLLNQYRIKYGDQIYLNSVKESKYIYLAIVFAPFLY